MGGRYGGDPKKRRKAKTPWQVSYAVMEAIGRASMPDLEKVGAKTRKMVQRGLHMATHRQATQTEVQAAAKAGKGFGGVRHARVED